MVSSVPKGMADENNEDDSWLYGSSNENQDHQDEQQSQSDEKITTNESIDQQEAGNSGNDKYDPDDPDDQQVSRHNPTPVLFSCNLKSLHFHRT